MRTLRYKLIYYYADGLDQPGVIDETKEPEWELFDLDSDPDELNNVYSDPAYADVVEELTAELHRLQAQLATSPTTTPAQPARGEDSVLRTASWVYLDYVGLEYS